jgi:hypothetical protein
MKIAVITIGCIAIAFIGFLILYNRWAMKQTLLGTWVTAAAAGSLITIQFEGGDQEGSYKQLVRRGDQQFREFGHWMRGMGFLRLVIMATDVSSHPRFGHDTQYNVSWIDRDTLKIDGPERPKWELKRASQDARIDFDVPTPAA